MKRRKAARSSSLSRIVEATPIFQSLNFLSFMSPLDPEYHITYSSSPSASAQQAPTLTESNSPGVAYSTRFFCGFAQFTPSRENATPIDFPANG